MSQAIIFAEQREGEIKKITYELITAAREAGATEIIALCCGDNLDCAKELASYGVAQTIGLQDPLFKYVTPDGYAKAISEEIKNHQPHLILFGHSAMGRDLAPRVAAILDTGCAADVTSLSNSSGKISITKYANSGKTIKTLNLTTEQVVLSVRPNAYVAAEKGSESGTFTCKDLGLSEGSIRVRVTDIVKGSDKLDLSEADTIVSGGRGLKGPENFNLVEDLAAALGGAVGASRAVVDAGWRPHSEQVGQTGKTVSPNLYVAVAISGAIQHLAGMSSSKVIVAINSDKDAPIFKIADYGIVGDAFEVVPALIEAVKAS